MVVIRIVISGFIDTYSGFATIQALVMFATNNSLINFSTDEHVFKSLLFVIYY